MLYYNYKIIIYSHTLRGFASSLIKRGAKKVLRRCQNHRNFIFLELISSLRIGLNNTPY